MPPISSFPHGLFLALTCVALFSGRCFAPASAQGDGSGDGGGGTDTGTCATNPKCASQGVSGDCCPSKTGVFMECCENFQAGAQNESVFIALVVGGGLTLLAALAWAVSKCCESRRKRRRNRVRAEGALGERKRRASLSGEAHAAHAAAAAHAASAQNARGSALHASPHLITPVVGGPHHAHAHGETKHEEHHAQGGEEEGDTFEARGLLGTIQRRQSHRKVEEQKTMDLASAAASRGRPTQKRHSHGVLSEQAALARQKNFGTTAHPSLIGDFGTDDILAEANRIHTEHELEKHRLEMAQAENRRVQQAHLKKRLAAARAHRLQNRKLKRAGTKQAGVAGVAKNKGKGGPKRGYTQFSPRWAKVKHELVDKKRLSRLVESGQSAEAVALAAQLGQQREAALAHEKELNSRGGGGGGDTLSTHALKRTRSGTMRPNLSSQAAAAAARDGAGKGGGMTAKEALAANRAGAAAYADAGGRAGQTRRAEDPTGRRDKAAERRKNRGNRKLSAAAEHAAHAVYDPRALTTEEEARRQFRGTPDCNESAAFAQLRPGFLTCR